MATERQIAYIHDLLQGLRPDNMAWWNKTIDTENKAQVAYQRHNRRRWIMTALNINEYSDEADDLDYDGAVALYNARLDELDAVGWADIDNRVVSSAIDALERCELWRVQE